LAQTSEEARAFIAERSRLHSKANHNCWGYKISKGLNQNSLEVFSSDDGEPSGTAGKPIIGAIEKKNITNTVIVISRYFGGHKLGIRGLIDAYSQSALLTLEKSGLFAYSMFEEINIKCAYSEWPRIQYEMEKQEIQAYQQNINYAEKIHLKLFVESNKISSFINVLYSYKMSHLEVDYQLTENRKFRAVKKIKPKVL